MKLIFGSHIWQKLKNSFFVSLFFLSFFCGTLVYAQESSTNLQQIYTPTPINQREGSLVNPNKAEGASVLQTAESYYSFFCWAVDAIPDAVCPPDRNTWSISLLVDMFVNFITMSLFNGKTAQDVIDYGPITMEEFTELKTTQLPTDGGFYRSPGGFAGYLAVGMDKISTEPIIPTNLAMFMQDATSDTILGKPAYAQRVWDSSFEKMVLSSWKITRNIALSLMGFVIGIAALMVMFRAQLGPRSVVTIYNVLPSIPLTLGLILFSYPIASLILNLITPLDNFAYAFGLAMFRNVGASGFAFPDSWGLGVLAIWAIREMITGLLSLGLGSIMTLLFIGVFAIVWFWIICAYFFMSIKILLSLMLTTIASPLVILMSALPGRNAMLLNLGKRYLVELLSLPALNIVYYIGLTIVVISPQNGNFYWTNPLIALGASFYLLLIFVAKLSIGLGIIWSARNMRSTLEKSFGVSNLFGGGGEDPRKH
jgi:hypothetical protein